MNGSWPGAGGGSSSEQVVNWPSLHLAYLVEHQKQPYDYFMQQMIWPALKANKYHDTEIESLVLIKTSLAYLVYKCGLHQLPRDHSSALAQIKNELGERIVCEFGYLLDQIFDQSRYLNLKNIITEERTVFAAIHTLPYERGAMFDMQSLVNALDHISFTYLRNAAKSVSDTLHSVSEGVNLSHDMGALQEKFDMCFEHIRTVLDSLRLEIYRLERDSTLRSKTTMGNERLMESEEKKCRVQVDYFLFAVRHWRALALQLQDRFRNNTNIQNKTCDHVKSADNYIRRMILLSFVMVRQPDSIIVMQTPRTQRILRDREFIKASFFALNNSLKQQWITIKSQCFIYLVGLNEYSTSDTVFDDFSLDRKVAYDGDFYEPNSKQAYHSNNNRQDFVGSNVFFPRVNMINQHLKRRNKEAYPVQTQKRKLYELTNCNAAPEELFSFVLWFKIEIDPGLGIMTHSIQNEMTVQTCSRPLAILVHANQKPPAEGKLFWCRFNTQWFMPLHEEARVSHDLFRKTLSEYTRDNYGRELSLRELDYLTSQITLEGKTGNTIHAKKVLRDSAQYTDGARGNVPQKRKSFWLWFHEVMSYLCKGKGKQATRTGNDNPLKGHWIDGRICLVSRKQAQDILAALPPGEREQAAVIRVSESRVRTLNVITSLDSWGVKENTIDIFFETLRDKLATIWSETLQTWVRTELVCKPREQEEDLLYRPFVGDIQLPPTTPSIASPASTSCLSPGNHHFNLPAVGSGPDSNSFIPFTADGQQPWVTKVEQTGYNSPLSHDPYSNEQIGGRYQDRVYSPCSYSSTPNYPTNPTADNLLNMMSMTLGEEDL